MKSILLLPALLIALCTAAQDYRVSSIPDSLLQDADAVKRFEELLVIVKGFDKVVIKHTCVYTILNENGEKFANYNNYYSKFRSLNDISGKMFDANGKLIKSIRKKDIADVSASDEETMITDTRYKRFAFYNKVYPYTVEFEDEADESETFFLPTWYPVSDLRLALQKSVFEVETPADFNLRYRQNNLADKPAIKNNVNTIAYEWELHDQKALLPEPIRPTWAEIAPVVYIAPTNFQLGAYKGNMGSWNEFGRFVLHLCDGRDQLPETTKQEVHHLTDGLSSKEEKVKAIYHFMQQNTHYIGIQLGIGGWQPFEAKYVAENKYGDCKALSNYMVSLLKEAGVKAYRVLIRAGEGERGLLEDFPATNFNHMIACVPNGKDTLWLECTDQTISPGYIGSSTGNRQALLISEDGGHVVRTPVYSTADNLQLRKAVVKIDDNGNMIADVTTHFTGTQQDLQHELMYSANKEEREKYLNSALNLPTYVVEKNDYRETRDRIPAIDERLQISAAGYATVSGKRLFITPNLFNRSPKLFEDRPRKFDIEFTESFKDADTVVIQVPSGYKAESVPKDVHIENRFGKYSINYEIAGNTIKLLRVKERQAATYPASAFTELVAYYDAVYKADHARIVLIKE